MSRNKKERIKRKHLKMRNRRLIKQYPWLLPRNVWTDKVPDDYDYTYVNWYGWPKGWNRAFGDMFLKEFGEAVKEAGLEQTIRIEQMKEKYGSMRCYINGGTEKIHQIINKYAHLSENICVACGKPDVPMIYDGWYSPRCYDCWKKSYRRNEKWIAEHRESYEYKTEEQIRELYDERVCSEDNSVIAESYKVTRFSNDGNITTETYDISDTVRAIRERWNKLNDGRDSRKCN